MNQHATFFRKELDSDSFHSSRLQIAMRRELYMNSYTPVTQVRTLGADRMSTNIAPTLFLRPAVTHPPLVSIEPQQPT